MNDRTLPEQMLSSKEQLIKRLSLFIDGAVGEKCEQYPLTNLLRDVRQHLQSSDETSAVGVIYFPCEKHRAIPWTANVAYAIPPKTVCPICEPPSKANAPESVPKARKGPDGSPYDNPFDCAAIMGSPHERRISMRFETQEQYEAALVFLDMADPPQKACDQEGTS